MRLPALTRPDSGGIVATMIAQKPEPERATVLPSVSSRLIGCLLAAVALSGSLAAQETNRPGRKKDESTPAVTPDVLDITLAERSVFVSDSSGVRPVIRLSLSERVVKTLSKGRVGVLVTTDRILFFADGQPDAVEYRWEMGEPQARALLGTRVAVAANNRRILFFDGEQAGLRQLPLSFQESLAKMVAYENVAVAATSQRIIAVTAGIAALAQADLDAGESVTDVDAHLGHATVTTGKRVFQYRAGDETWLALLPL